MLDASGEIAEVHVMATGERQPKQIVRDVESTLLAKLGTKVDHRKISVALFDEKKDDPEMAATLEAMASRSGALAEPVGATARGADRAAALGASADEPGDEARIEPSRLRYVGMNLHVTGTGCQARVELLRGELRTLGNSSTPAVGAGALRSVAEATLRAVMHCYEEGPVFAIDDVAFVTVAQREAVFVSVGYHVGREAVHLLGSTFVGRDPQQAVIFATLDAVNRFSGRLKEREFIEYEVGPAPARS